jgi:hypothetical protein
LDKLRKKPFSIARHSILFQEGEKKINLLATFEIGCKILHMMIICFDIRASPTFIPTNQV